MIQRQSLGWCAIVCAGPGGAEFGYRSRCRSSVEQAGCPGRGGWIPAAINALLPALAHPLQNEIEPLRPGRQQPAQQLIVGLLPHWPPARSLVGS